MGEHGAPDAPPEPSAGSSRPGRSRDGFEADCPEPSDSQRRRGLLLLASVFVVAGCGLAYELVMSTAASFLLGATVLRFSLTIGLFLSALGLGAALSRHVEGDLLGAFVAIEILVAAVGGLSAALVYVAYGWTGSVRAVTIILPLVVGTLVGLELPLLVRILSRWDAWKDTLANVLSFDYLGGLAASLLFPLVLLPHLGIVRSALAFGALNALVGLITAAAFRRDSPACRRLVPVAGGVVVALVLAFGGAGFLVGAVERTVSGGRAVASFRTPWQHVLLARRGDELRLFLDGHLQFSTSDEARYHESLAHPALGATPRRDDVLIVGGGDGLLAREVLRWDDVKRVVLVDLDARLVRFCREQPELARLSEGALDDPRVDLIIADGFDWLRRTPRTFDRILLDLPDPRSEGVARLYSVEFYATCLARLRPGGVVATQASSPWYAPRVFWCIVASMEAAGLAPVPGHVNVPSFGEWGFVFAAREPLDHASGPLPDGLRFLTPEVRDAIFAWPADLEPPDVEPSHFDRPVLLDYHARDWSHWEGDA